MRQQQPTAKGPVTLQISSEASRVPLPLCLLVLLLLSLLLPLAVCAASERSVSTPAFDLHPSLHGRTTSIVLTRGAPIPPPAAVPLSPRSLCSGCHVTLQEFFRFLLGSLQHEEYEGQIELAAVSSVFCTGEPFDHLRPEYTAACQQLVADSAESMLEPMLGQRTVGYYVQWPMRQFLEYKQTTCAQLANCSAAVFPLPSPAAAPSRAVDEDCTACEQTAALLSAVLGREADVEAAGVTEYLLRALCLDIPFWYERPAAAEAFCMSLIEDTDWKREMESVVVKEGRRRKAQREHAAAAAALTDDWEAEQLEESRSLLRSALCSRLTATCPPELKRRSRSDHSSSKQELR